MKETYRCWAEIDRAALRHNAKVVRDRIGPAELLAVVKANAYGHGLVGVAKALADDAQLFGVANLQEALTLRESLPHPIMILGPATPEERPIIAEHGFIPTISSLEEAEAFDRLKPVSVNFKIDTGMGRMGVVQNEACQVFQRVAAMANLEIHSISTHMPVSNEDAEYTRDQLVRFQKNRGPNSHRSSGKLQGARIAKRRHTRVQSADLRNRARRYHALRYFAAPGIS